VSQVKLDVYVAPGRPMVGTPAQGSGDEPMWSPMSATLLHGDKDAVLVDTLVTFDQVDALADWIDGFGVNLTHIYITHGHGDHWIGLTRLLERFPNARGVATAEVVERARFESTFPALVAYWQGVFPGEVPAAPVVPSVLDSNAIDLEGNALQVLHVGRGDTEHSTVLYAPSIGAVVAGDLVYNGVHMMLGEADAAARAEWIAANDEIEKLKPRTVVAGHKAVGAADGIENLEATRQYLRDFSRIAAEQSTVEGIVDAMMAIHGDRVNPRVVWHSARTEVARRTAA
jgi:glyoxylase-like metal-dependent hydrolase (beta-lactamase superfamily II)